MNDFLLEISCDLKREEEMIARLFLTRSTGSTSDDLGLSTLITAYFESAADRDDAAAFFADVDVRASERAIGRSLRTQMSSGSPSPRSAPASDAIFSAQYVRGMNP